VTWAPGKKTGVLLFTDIPANVVYRLAPDGKAEIHLEKAGYQKPDLWRVGMPFTNGKKEGDPGFEKFNMSGANGLALDPQGRLIIAAFGSRSIDRIEKNGKRTVLAGRYEGKRLNGPNDVVVRRDGSIYFTDTYSGLPKLDKDPAKEMDVVGIYMLRNGRLTRLIDDIMSPNGLAFSPDETFLYVNGGRERFIRRYDVKADGTLGDSVVIADLDKEKAPGITDGTKVDAKGNIWTTGPGGIWVLSPIGKPLGVIPLPEGGTNLAFGDSDRKTLYISARTSIYRISTLVAGAPLAGSR
ncbi:MAG: SMP-30/gluconolactonase/LRE family protein, partial [Rhizobiales bacterium]|nr:SMP-30/gluconolactonase/LRE family protein [Hyphomicrobiales bacterium]